MVATSLIEEYRKRGTTRMQERAPLRDELSFYFLVSNEVRSCLNEVKNSRAINMDYYEGETFKSIQKRRYLKCCLC